MAALVSSSFARQITIVASALAIVLIALMLTTLPFGRGIDDLFVLLDGAYRMSLGQTPHVHFASPIGPLLLYMMHWGETLLPSANPYVAYHAVMWLLVLPAFAYLAPRFASIWHFAAAFALLAIMILLPMTLDKTHLSEISYFASYNRFASGLLFVLGLWYVLPKARLDGVMLGYLLLLLLFIKVTAAIVGFGIILAALILRRCSWHTPLMALLVFVVANLALDLHNGIVSGYLKDIAGMIAINQSSGLYKLFYAAFHNWLAMAALGLLVLFALQRLLRPQATDGEGAATAKRPNILVRLFSEEKYTTDTALLVIAALGAESQNTGGLGLLAAAAIAFHPDAWRRDRMITLGLVAILVLPVLDMALRRGVTAMVREKMTAAEQPLESLIPGTRVPHSTYEGALLIRRLTHDLMHETRRAQENRFFMIHDPTTNAVAYRLYGLMEVIEAAKIFEEKGLRGKAERYTTLIFADHFARLLKLEPAQGTMLTMDVGRTIPRLNTEGARNYLANVDGVFNDLCDMTQARIDLSFEQVLREEFDRYPLTKCWDFHARKK